MASAVPRRKLLLVEDDNSARTSLKELFFHSGYSVQAVKHAHEALGIASSFRPEIFVCNVRLSTMSGSELADEVLKLIPTCQILLMLPSTSGVKTEPARLVSPSPRELDRLFLFPS